MVKSNLINVTNETADKYFEVQKKIIKSLLDKDEKLKVYIKGINTEMLRMAKLISTGTFKTNDIGFNYTMFITDKRIFYCDTNYFNAKISEFKIFNIEDVKEITFNKVTFGQAKEIKKKWGGILHPSTLANLNLNVPYTIGTVISIGAIQSMFTFLYNQLSLFGSYPGARAIPFDITSVAAIMGLISSIGVVTAIYLIIMHFTKYKLRVSLTTKNDDYIDFIVVNSDFKFVMSELSNIQDRISKCNE